jgi:hypothetical protein
MVLMVPCRRQNVLGEGAGSLDQLVEGSLQLVGFRSLGPKRREDGDQESLDPRPDTGLSGLPMPHNQASQELAFPDDAHEAGHRDPLDCVAICTV